MAGTLLDMKARILSELANRSDMPPYIALAINDAIAVCQKYRFRFSDGSVGINTVPGTFAYSISGIFSVDYAVVATNGGLVPLRRTQPELVRMKASTPSGTPTHFAIELEYLLLAPTPDAIALVGLFGFILVPAPANDDVIGNRWMTDGERMIRALAKREIFRNVLRNKEMADEMDKAFIAERDQLLSESGRLELYQGMQSRQTRVAEAP